MNRNKKLYLSLVFLLIFNCPFSPYSRQNSYAESQIKYPNNLWKGLIAESTNATYEEWYAVACVVRNRLNSGLWHGLVGLKRTNLDSFVEKEVKYMKSRYGKDIEALTKSIIKEVFEQNGKDITKGATHYENIERYGIPYWAAKMTIVCKIGEHTFYKERG